MAQLRFEALKKLTSRPKVTVEPANPHISEFFGQNVFGIEQMRATLAPAVFKKVSAAIKNHEKIDETTADAVASAAKSWAISKGATHFTHWFQPMTGGTAAIPTATSCRGKPTRSRSTACRWSCSSCSSG